MQRKYGLIIDIPKKEDNVLGGFTKSPEEILQPDKDWTPYLPVKEYQNLNAIEPYACVSFTILNCGEILIKKKYGIEKNYSDRFLAAISDTKNGGNSPKIVAQFLHELGVVPQELWPFDETITSFEKFYEPIPEKLKELAKEFLNEFNFRYEFVKLNHKDISKALTMSPLLMSVYAWILNDKGLYYRPDGETDIHATTLVYERENEFRRVFDSYADGEGDPAIKDYDWNSLPKQVMRFYISRKELKENWFISFLKKLWS